MDGPADAKKNVKPHGNAAPERRTTKMVQNRPSKKNAIFAPSKRTDGLMGSKKQPSLIMLVDKLAAKCSGVLRISRLSDAKNEIVLMFYRKENSVQRSNVEVPG